MVPRIMVHHPLPSHHGVPPWQHLNFSVRTQQEHSRTVFTGSVKGRGVTSRLIESRPCDLPSRWSKVQRGVFQPPGSRPPPSRVATHDECVAIFSLPFTTSKRVLWAYS